MSDLHELPDLAGDVSARAVTPEYDEVVRRVRARRRRTAAGSLVAVALVAAGVAVWQGAAGDPAARPEPAGHTQSPVPMTDESLWRKVVDGTDAHPFGVAGTDDGAVAILWRALEQPAPTYALVIREANGTLHGRRLVEPVTLTPVPGGWVAVEGSRGWFVSSDGTWSELGGPGAPRRPQPGDVLVVEQYVRGAFRPSDRTWRTSAVGYGDRGGGYLSSAGLLVDCYRSDPGTIGIVRDGDRVAEGPGSACLVAGHGDHVVVVLTGDAADGSIPIKKVLASDDGGVTWSPVVFAPGSLNSVAVLADGTPVIGTDAGALTVGQSQSGEGEHGLAFAAGQRLYTLAYGQSKGPLSYTDGNGDTWHETTLPGLE